MTLILTVGLPRSGKTTWARSTGYPIVSPDAIRLALHGQRYFAPAEPMVWAVAHLMVEALFAAGSDTVVVDACNATEKRRAEWKGAELHIINTSPIECIKRALLNDDEAIVPTIKRMAEEWDLPRPWEEPKP